jgi:hypothetical protein
MDEDVVIKDTFIFGTLGLDIRLGLRESVRWDALPTECTDVRSCI